jgi:TP901 family phage tail tape measure protein
MTTGCRVASHRIDIIVNAVTSGAMSGLKAVGGAVTSAGDAAKGAAASAGTAAKGFLGAGQAGQNASDGLGAAGSAASGAGANLQGAAGFAGLAGRALEGLGNFAKQALTHFAGYASVIALMRGVEAAFRFVKDAVLGFDSALTQSTAIMGDVSAEVKKSLGDTALRVAVDYNTSVKDVAAGYYYLVSAGYDVESSQKLIGQATAFAKAGMFDLEKATELAADAQTALGLKTKDAVENQRQFTRVTDVLTEANNKASGTVEQFASALNNKAAASARVYGISLEETVSVLMAFHEQGMKASKAGTAFDIVLRDIVRGARLHEDAWKKLGITVFDAMGNFNGFSTVIGQMEHALAGMSVEEKDATLATLGLQLRSVNFTKSLLGTSDQLREFKTELENAGGATQAVADKQMTSMIERLAHLRTMAEVAAVQGFAKLAQGAQFLDREFAPAIDNLVAAGRKVANLFAPLAESLAKIGGATAVVAVKVLATALEAATEQADKFATVLAGLLLLGISRLAVTIGSVLVPAVAAMARSFQIAAIDGLALRFMYAADGARLLVGQTIATGSAMQGAAASAYSFRTALSGMSALPLIAVATAAFAIFQNVQDADRASREAAQSLANWNPNNVESMDAAWARLSARQTELSQKLATYPGAWQKIGSAMADVLIPFGDVGDSAFDLGNDMGGVNEEMQKILNRRVAINGAFYDIAAALTDLDDKAKQVPDTFNNVGVAAQELANKKSAAEITRIRDALAALAREKGIDPTVAEGRKELERLYQLGRETAPVGQIAEAFGIIGDAASDAEDTVKAFKDALDAVFGVAINVHDAQTKVATGFAAMAKQAGESRTAIGLNAGAFDLNSLAALRNLEIVAANRDAVSAQAQNVLKLATAYREQGMGSAEAADDMMKQYEALVKQVQGYGLTEAQARSYLATLNLTPTDIDTIAVLETGTAEERATRLQMALDEIKKGALGLVGVEKEEAARKAADLQRQLDLIKQGANAFVGAEKEDAQRRINAVQAELDRIKQGANATVTANTAQAEAAIDRVAAKMRSMGGSITAVEQMNRANGGITLRQYAAGGEYHTAQVAPAGAWRLWAEPETGGEAYIPLAASKRARSTEILDDVARMFGYHLVRYGPGGTAMPAMPSQPVAGPGGGHGIVVQRGAVAVTVRADASVDGGALAMITRQAIEPALDDFARRLHADLRAR